MRILLIAGHGANDPGAVANGYKEANLTRELVNKLAPILRRYAKVDVYDTNRNAFNDVSRGRFKIGRYDYLLEIHFNAHTNTSAHGCEIYVTTREKGVGVESSIMDEMRPYFKIRGIKRQNFAVINHSKNKGISSALLEVCFITNKNDVNTYQKNKNAIAEAIAQGIARGFGLQATVGTIDDVARQVIAGNFGNGTERKKRLKEAGYNPQEVQKRVNELLK